MQSNKTFKICQVLLLIFCWVVFQGGTVTLVPTGDVSVDWARGEGAANYECVDDSTCTEAGGNAVYTTTDNHTDKYSMTDYTFPAGDNVIDSVVLYGCAAVNSESPGYFNLRVGLYSFDTANFYFTDSIYALVSETWQSYDSTWATNPYTSAPFTDGDLDSLNVLILRLSGDVNPSLVSYINAKVYSSDRRRGAASIDGGIIDPSNRRMLE